jgi:predicted NBD/HSP70 family sugar kinase
VGQNLTSLREANRRIVLRLLYRRSGLSRRELAQQTGLDASTISHIIGELLDAGLVRECQRPATRVLPRRGRRQIGLELVPTAIHAIGVHLGVRSVRVAACDLLGQIVARRAMLIPPSAPAETVLRDLGNLIADLLTDAPLRQRRLAGVGIGAIAFLDPEQGVIDAAPSLGWGRVEVAGPLARRLGVPVLLDHHVRAMAIAEQWFGQAHDVSTFALVNVDSSIGAGLVVDGQLVRGDHARAGQVAHLIVAPDGPPCTCGRRGCLVALASYRAVAAHAHALARQQPHSALAQAVAEHPSMPIDYLVFDLAREGDATAQGLIEELADYVATLISTLVSLIDPQLVVLAAASAAHAEQLLVPIQARVNAQAPLSPRLAVSALEPDLAVLGGAALVLDRLIAGRLPRAVPGDGALLTAAAPPTIL